jgi:4,5-dihydroxyphthalate decarboxylase
MHCVVLRKDWHQRKPWALRHIYEALLKARQKIIEDLSDTKALAAMIPMLPAVMEETLAVFGTNFWPYGMEENRKTLEKLVLYAYQQGLTPRELSVDELFGESVRT